MNFDDAMKLVSDTVALSAVIPLGAFVYRYVRYSPFEINPEGKNLLLQKISMLLLILLIVLAAIDPGYWGRQVIRFSVFTALVVLFWGDLINLVRIQRQYPYKRVWFKRLRSQFRK